MKYPNKIYICRNMMGSDVDSLFNECRVTNPAKTCSDYDASSGKCLYDGKKCAIVEYQKVKK